MQLDDQQPFKMGPWTVRPAAGALECDGEVKRLEPRVMSLLVRLALEPGKVVSKDELLHSVWGEAFVEEGALSRCIFEIRKALGERASKPRFIETLPKRGYRLITEVHPLADSETVNNPSIAVLPFVDLSATQDQGYFADGLAEELIHALAQVRGLQVTARTSSFAFRGRELDIRTVGKELAVAAVVEGSVRREGARVRIAVQLIDAATGYHIWSKRYDRELDAVFEVQDEIAHSVVQRVGPELLSNGTVLAAAWTDNVQVLDLCLEAEDLARMESREGLSAAVDGYLEAIELDPACAMAWAGLAGAKTAQVIYRLAPIECLGEARLAAEKAIELGEDHGRAYVALATVELFAWNWQAAVDACRKAYSTAPGRAFTRFTCRVVWQSVGHLEEALEHASAACKLNPRSAIYHRGLGTVLLLLERWEEAVVHLERAFEINPLSGYCDVTLAVVKWRLGERSDCLTILSRKILPNDGLEMEVAREKGDDALRLILSAWREKGAHGHWFFVAVFEAFLGEHEKALEALQQALSDRESTMINLGSWPTFEALRTSPDLGERFQALLDELGLGDPDSY